MIFTVIVFSAHAQETEEVDPVFDASIYYGLAFFVQAFPDETLEHDNIILYKKKFVVRRYVINYRLILNNRNIDYAAIVIWDNAYMDFFDGLDESDYDPELSGNKPLSKEEFEKHKLLFHDLAYMVSEWFPNVSILAMKIERVKFIDKLIENNDPDSEFVKKMNDLRETFVKEQHELIDIIQEEKPIIKVYDDYYVIILKYENNIVGFEVHQLPWNGIEPPEELDDSVI